MLAKKIDRWCLHAKAVYKPDVVDIRFEFGKNHYDEACVTFTMIVSDAISDEQTKAFRERVASGKLWDSPSRLLTITKAVMGLLRSKIDFEGNHVYSTVRSVSEDKKP